LGRIDTPHHYNHSDLECIDAIIAALGVDGAIDYCRGSAMKYLWRARYKKSPAKDMAKAAWYCQKASELFDKQVVDAPTSDKTQKNLAEEIDSAWSPKPWK